MTQYESGGSGSEAGRLHKQFNPEVQPNIEFKLSVELFTVPLKLLTNLLFPMNHSVNHSVFLLSLILPLKVQAGKRFKIQVQSKISSKLLVNLFIISSYFVANLLFPLNHSGDSRQFSLLIISPSKSSSW